jgi:hypothetical protein
VRDARVAFLFSQASFFQLVSAAPPLVHVSRSTGVVRLGQLEFIRHHRHLHGLRRHRSVHSSGSRTAHLSVDVRLVHRLAAETVPRRTTTRLTSPDVDQRHVRLLRFPATLSFISVDCFCAQTRLSIRANSLDIATLLAIGTRPLILSKSHASSRQFDSRSCARVSSAIEIGWTVQTDRRTDERAVSRRYGRQFTEKVVVSIEDEPHTYCQRYRWFPSEM